MSRLFCETWDPTTFTRHRQHTLPGYPRQMPKKLHRFYGDGDLHFITFSCYKRQQFLNNSAYGRLAHLCRHIPTEDAPPAAHFGGWATMLPQATGRTLISARSASFTTTGPASPSE
jgi:hypothetical protein